MLTLKKIVGLTSIVVLLFISGCFSLKGTIKEGGQEVTRIIDQSQQKILEGQSIVEVLQRTIDRLEELEKTAAQDVRDIIRLIRGQMEDLLKSSSHMIASNLHCTQKQFRKEIADEMTEFKYKFLGYNQPVPPNPLVCNAYPTSVKVNRIGEDYDVLTWYGFDFLDADLQVRIKQLDKEEIQPIKKDYISRVSDYQVNLRLLKGGKPIGLDGKYILYDSNTKRELSEIHSLR